MIRNMLIKTWFGTEKQCFLWLIASSEKRAGFLWEAYIFCQVCFIQVNNIFYPHHLLLDIHFRYRIHQHSREKEKKQNVRERGKEILFQPERLGLGDQKAGFELQWKVKFWASSWLQRNCLFGFLIFVNNMNHSLRTSRGRDLFDQKRRRWRRKEQEKQRRKFELSKQDVERR